MDPLQAAALFVALILPFHVVIRYEVRRMSNPRHIRRGGVTIRRHDAIEARGPVIGYFQDSEIYASLVVMGVRYRFERIVIASYVRRVGERELYLDPGLLYVVE